MAKEEMTSFQEVSRALSLHLSNVFDAELVALELEGFAFGMALSDDSGIEPDTFREAVGAIVGGEVQLDLVNCVRDLSAVIRKDLALRNCLLPSHLAHLGTVSSGEVELDLIGKTVLWMDGLMTAAKVCAKGWPRVLFKFDKSDQFIEIFTFIEDQSGASVIDVDDSLIDRYRLQNLKLLPASLLRLYNACRKG